MNPVAQQLAQDAPAFGRRERAGWRGIAWGKAVPALGFVAVVAMGAAHGSYFPTTWGWSALVFAWVAALALGLRSRIQLGSLELLTLGALLAFTGWVAISTVWSYDVGQTVLEVERDLVYPLGLLTALLVVRRRGVPQLLGGLLGGIALLSAYGLATRLFPERLGSFNSIAVYRLDAPLGYWNAVAIFAVMGVLLAVGFATRARTLQARTLAGAALPVLVTTLYYTFGRGPWVALGVGLLAAIAFDPRRLHLLAASLVLAPVSVLAVWLATRSHALTTLAAPLGEASHDGHRLAVVVGLLTVVSGALAFGLAVAERRLSISTPVRRGFAAGIVLVAVASLTTVFVSYGSPATLAREGYRAFKQPPAGPDRGGSLNIHLLQLSSNGRIDMWHIAWRDYAAHPWHGSGAGTYEQYWLRDRPTSTKVRDAHSLYMEVLAELGTPGLALLLVALAVPIVAAVRARSRPLVPAAFAAYLAFALHAGVDWDWELTVVTMTGFFLGAALLISARDEDALPALPRRIRLAAIGATLAIAGFALVGLLANSALDRSADAIRARHWTTAAEQARDAMRWAPWSPRPWHLLGEAQVGSGRLAAGQANLRKAIAMDPRDWVLWYDLGIATEGAEQRHALLQALRLNPRSPEIAEFTQGVGIELPQVGSR